MRSESFIFLEAHEGPVADPVIEALHLIHGGFLPSISGGQIPRSLFRLLALRVTSTSARVCTRRSFGSVLDVEMTILDKHPEGISIDA